MRVILLGNAGAGKTTMARRLMGGRDVPRLSLDEIAWNEGPERKPLAETLGTLETFLVANDEWIIEGCYGDLVEAALPYCSELRFLNPGVETCVTHCLARTWEPTKFATPEEQNASLQHLVDWVRQYEMRDDEYGLRRHRAIFDRFDGPKREYTTIASYDGDPTTEARG
jgi:adenylate kinase family enzyme